MTHAPLTRAHTPLHSGVDSSEARIILGDPAETPEPSLSDRTGGMFVCRRLLEVLLGRPLAQTPEQSSLQPRACCVFFLEIRQPVSEDAMKPRLQFQPLEPGKDWQQRAAEIDAVQPDR